MVEGVLHSDDGCRPNPGEMFGGFVLRVDGRKIERRLRFGPGTNNTCEYRSLIAGMEAALAEGVTKLHARSDSLILVRAVQRTKPRKKGAPHLAVLAAKARELAGRFVHGFDIRWVSRDRNTEADRLTHPRPGRWRRAMAGAAA